MPMIATACQGAPHVAFFDSADGTVLAKTPVAPEPHEICLDPKRGLLYVVHTYTDGFYDVHTAAASVITIVDAATHEVVEVLDIAPHQAPHGILYDADRDLMIISVESDEHRTGGLLLLDADTRTVVERFDVAAHGPHWLTMTDDKIVYTANKEAPFVSIVDSRDGAFLGKIALPSSEGIDRSPDGSRIYVTTPSSSKHATGEHPDGVQVIDTASGKIIDTIASDSPLCTVHVTQNGTILTVETPQHAGEPRLLHAYDGNDHSPLAEVLVGSYCPTLRSDADFAYVSATFDGAVHVVDLATWRTSVVAEVGAGAHGLAVL